MFYDLFGACEEFGSWMIQKIALAFDENLIFAVG